MQKYLESTFMPKHAEILIKTSRDLMRVIRSFRPYETGPVLIDIAEGKFDFKPYNLDPEQIKDLEVAGKEFKLADNEYFLLNNFAREVDKEYQDRQDAKSGCSIARCLNSL